MKVKRRQVLVRIHEWMYAALAAEARANPVPTSVNRLIIEALLAKYRNLAGAMNNDGAVSKARKQLAKR